MEIKNIEGLLLLDLEGADLIGADLEDANLRLADLRDANLGGTILEGLKI